MSNPVMALVWALVAFTLTTSGLVLAVVAFTSTEPILNIIAMVLLVLAGGSMFQTWRHNEGYA